MDSRASALFLSAMLLAAAAPASAAEDSGRQVSAAQRIQSLEGELSDPADFRSFVEGSHRLPEGAPVPRAQLWPQPSSQAAVPGAALSPAVSSFRPESGAVPPAPAFVRRAPAPVAENLPKYPFQGLAAVALLTVGLFAFVGKREFQAAPAAEAWPMETPAWSGEKPPSLYGYRVPAAADSSAQRLLARLEAPLEPFIDTRMPVPTWRAISLSEQRLIERWDASLEKARGQASFAEWLDAQGSVAGVDTALLKTKLSRDA